MNTARSSPFTSSGSNRKGFTFIETIIVVSLVVIVLTTVFGAFYYSSKNSAETRAGILVKQELIQIFHRMRRQLINAYEPEKGAAVLGEEGVRTGSDSICFLTTSLEDSQSTGEAAYRIERDDEGNSYLAYSEFPYPRSDNRFATNNVTDKWRKASALIREMEIEYEDNKKWSDGWTSKDLPDRIRITFRYGNREQVENRTLDKFTFTVVPGVKSSY